MCKTNRPHTKLSSHSILAHPARKLERDSITSALQISTLTEVDKTRDEKKNTELNNCLFPNHTCTSLSLYISYIQENKGNEIF